MPTNDFNQINQLEIDVGEEAINIQEENSSEQSQSSSEDSIQNSENVIEIIIKGSDGEEKLIILSY